MIRGKKEAVITAMDEWKCGELSKNIGDFQVIILCEICIGLQSIQSTVALIHEKPSCR